MYFERNDLTLNLAPLKNLLNGPPMNFAPFNVKHNGLCLNFVPFKVELFIMVHA